MFNFKPKLSTKEQISFAKRLSFLTKTGVSLKDSVSMLELQSAKRTKPIFTSIYTSLTQGQYLYKCLSVHKNSFSPFFINIIKVSEESGLLSTNLEYLSEELQKKQQLKKKIVGALIYPAFIALSTLLLSGFLTLVIFPKIRPLFSSLKVELPITTRFLMSTTSILERYWIYMLVIGCACLISSIFALKKNKRLQFIRDSLLIKIPLIGPVIRNFYIATLTRNLGTLIQAGIPFHEALTIASDISSNLCYKKAFIDIAEYARAGDQVSTHLSHAPHLFPKIACDLIAIAETSGQMAETLLYISDYFEQEVSDTTKNLSNALEPILMASMGIIVGFISLSIITPIYAITQNIKH